MSTVHTTPLPQGPPPAPPRRRSPAGWVLVVLGLVLAAVLAACAAVGILGALVRGGASGDETFQGVRAVEVVNGCPGDVEVRGGAAASGLSGGAEVAWEDRYGFRAPEHRQVLTGGTLRVEVDCPRLVLGSSPTSDLALTVPPGAAVDLSASVGDVDAQDLGGAVEIDTGVGDITVDGASAGVSADTGTGDITLTGLTGEEVRADTGVGDVELTALAAPRSVEVDTGVGDVAVLVPGGTSYDVRSDVGTGATRVEVPEDPAAQATMDLDVGVGDVTVRTATP